MPSPETVADDRTESVHAHAQSRDSHETISAAPKSVVQVVKNFFGSGTRAQDTILAIATVVIVLQAVALYTAYKDMQTQTWLRDDALTKFMSGPYADLRAETKANQILISSLQAQCLRPK